MKRVPRGYLGLNHQTIGSDILAILKVLHAPERSLGPALASRLKAVKPDQWYPIELMLEAMEAMDKNLDAYALKSAGWTLFKMSHADAAKAVAKSATDIITAFDTLYHQANRGEGIGGWKVLRLEPGLAELEKNTPHHCILEEGILEEALRGVGVPAKIEQRQCFRRGDPCCVYVVTSRVTDERWTGEKQLS